MKGCSETERQAHAEIHREVATTSVASSVGGSEFKCSRIASSVGESGWHSSPSLSHSSQSLVEIGVIVAEMVGDGVQ